jgi:phospholipase/carboxylesterase
VDYEMATRLAEPSARTLPPALELAPSGRAEASVIVLHGLAADVRDFVAAAGRLRLPPELRLRWLFPQAPVRPVTIEGGCRVRAWYDVRCYDRARMDEEGILKSEEVIRLHIRREVNRGVPPGRIVLAGFSQGGAMALHTGLRYPTSLGGIIALGSAIPLPHRIPPCRGGPPILLGHGLLDRVVRYALGAASRDFLSASGYRVEWHAYAAGHSVCAREMWHVSRFLGRVLAPAPKPGVPWSGLLDLGRNGRTAAADSACAGADG